jgi:hypothetical protein
MAVRKLKKKTVKKRKANGMFVLKFQLEKERELHGIRIDALEEKHRTALITLKREAETGHNDELVRQRLACQIELARIKKEYEEKLIRVEADLKAKHLSEKEVSLNQQVLEKEKLIEGHYEKLSAAMTKLHEEGNANTRFTKELALQLIGSKQASLPVDVVKTEKE